MAVKRTINQNVSEAINRLKSRGIKSIDIRLSPLVKQIDTRMKEYGDEFELDSAIDAYLEDMEGKRHDS